MKKLSKLLYTFIIGLLLYYFMLPAINLSAPEFWVFVGMLLFVYWLLHLASLIKVKKAVRNQDILGIPGFKLIAGLAGIIIGGILIINVVCSPLFNAGKYATRIWVDETKDFAEDVEAVDFKTVPLLDKASSRKLGDRTMGQITDLVSQFYVSDLYTQINYNNDIVRVTPLEYADLIKYFTNRSQGVEGYIIVNSVNGDSKLIRLEEGMKYMPSAFFFEDLNRHLRFSYPTKIFGVPTFEVDEAGRPFWIIPTIKYVGIGLREEITGVVVLDPITGDSEIYAVGEVPVWIDHVFSANLILNQVNNWGTYRNGFWNSIFGQKNVVNATEGYNYLALEEDIYLYTGITSVSTDESNLGFILTNLRTKETNYYLIAGAEEYSAMASAEGLVQEKRYVATFPLLINLNGKPTYLLSLKDNAGLVKMYAFIDVVDYQKVITNDAALGIEAAANKYLNEVPSTGDNALTKTTTIEIKTIKTAVIDGTTHYYLTDKSNQRYTVSIKTGRNILPYLEVGQKLTVTYYEDELRVITEITKKS